MRITLIQGLFFQDMIAGLTDMFRRKPKPNKTPPLYVQVGEYNLVQTCNLYRLCVYYTC